MQFGLAQNYTMNTKNDYLKVKKIYIIKNLFLCIWVFGLQVHLRTTMQCWQRPEGGIRYPGAGAAGCKWPAVGTGNWTPHVLMVSHWRQNSGLYSVCVLHFKSLKLCKEWLLNLHSTFCERVNNLIIDILLSALSERKSEAEWSLLGTVCGYPSQD